VDTAVTGSRVFESSFDRHEREIESEAEKYLEKLRGQKQMGMESDPGIDYARFLPDDGMFSIDKMNEDLK
jgi:hypothetical protein